MDTSYQNQSREEIVTWLVDELKKLNQFTGSRDISKIHEAIVKKEELLKELRELLAQRNSRVK